MANLNKRRNFNRPFEEHEVDHNWDVIDVRTRTSISEFDSIQKIATRLQELHFNQNINPLAIYNTAAGN